MAKGHRKKNQNGNIKETFLNISILTTFRGMVNSSNVFSNVPEYRNLWNLMCALTDRLESATSYLNSHPELPKTEDDLILYLVYAAMLKDGVYKFYENVYKTMPPTISNKRWFTDAHGYSIALFDDANCPTDDVFFEYLRALAFAHPFGVSHRKGRIFMSPNEVHYSPWVIAGFHLSSGEDDIGLRIYKDNQEGLEDIFISFKNLKGYLSERFNLIKKFIEWGNGKIQEQNNIWKQKKIDRRGGAIEILKNVCDVLDERFIDHYLIDEAIKILESSFDEDINKKAVNALKNKIEQSIESICDCSDNLDYEGIENNLGFIYERPLNLHSSAQYELEKIFDYLKDERGTCFPGSNEVWGLIQANNFYNSYARKYVVIDFVKMTNLQIKILVRASLFMGVTDERNASNENNS